MGMWWNKKMGNKKVKLQKLMFSKKLFSKRDIRVFVKSKGFIVDKRLKYPIMNDGEFLSVRQRNPDWFKKSTLVFRSLGRGVKGVYGYIK